jgi:isoaspartyl peptidase/L-asparaginase-like protein (Ntn-hydrolase superfamily)
LVKPQAREALLRDGAEPAVIATVAVTRLERASAGRGGLIIVDPYGRIGYAFNAPHMTLAWMRRDLAEAALGA